jgi:hypothetical protein
MGNIIFGFIIGAIGGIIVGAIMNAIDEDRHHK